MSNHRPSDRSEVQHVSHYTTVPLPVHVHGINNYKLDANDLDFCQKDRERSCNDEEFSYCFFMYLTAFVPDALVDAMPPKLASAPGSIARKQTF